MSSPDIMNSSGSLTEILSMKIADVNEPPSAESCVDAPAWLTKEYMEHCLRTHYKDTKLRIQKMDARPALGKGENYGGVLTRIKAEFKTGAGCSKTGHYIVKTSFEGDGFALDKMAPYDIFNREMSIYESVLPKLNALLEEIGDSEQIFAETMAVDYERSALVFEDLNVREFTMPDRTQGLDMNLTKLVLRKLAKMHATSAVLNEREGGSLESYDRGMFNRHTDNYAPCFLGLLDACSRLVSQWKDLEHYGRKLKDLRPAYMELSKRVFDPIQGHLNVLAHGDLWTNNVMVKYDKSSGEPLDVIIIDFQYSAWGSPAIDLFYLLNSSLKEDMHLYRQDELIKYYYDVLADTLFKLAYNANIPSLHSFHLQLEAKSFYAFHSTCIVLPVQRNEVTDDADFNALMQENERAVNFKNTCYKNPYCQRLIRQLLPMYERKGLLEVKQ